MRTLLAFALLTAVSACSRAEDKKPNEPEKKLGIGDVAPPLTVTKWLNGPETKIEKGNVYILEFWATWCGPCIASMPHLAEIREEYKDKGLKVIAVTSKDPNNSQEDVEKFVAKKGAKFGFTYAYCDSRETDKAYMQAAGQDGIPCSFVVGKDGKIAFIGHPMELDDVLPKVIDGTWRGQADVDAIQENAKKLGEIFAKAETDIDTALKQLAEYEKANPHKAKQEMFQVSKVAMLMQGKKIEDAKVLSEPLLKKLIEKKNASLLGNLRNIWAAKELNPDKKHIEIATQAADAVLTIEGDTPVALYGAAETYSNAGDKTKAIALLEKAIAAAENDRQKEFLKKKLEEYKK